VSVITMTDKAAQAIANIQERMNAPAVRISLKKGGCAGMEYTFDALDNIPTGVLIATHNKAVLAIDPVAEMFLLGVEIDYTEGLLESGFVFKNPNVTSSCGCGASVSF